MPLGTDCHWGGHSFKKIFFYITFVISYQQKGTKAPQAAGKIHTDFEKGFIMAEVMKFSDFKEEGSESAVKVCVFYIHSYACVHAINFANTLYKII